MKKLIIFLCLATLYCGYSQEETHLDYNNTIGIKLSNISGYGIYFNRSITNNFNIQIKGLVYYYMRQEEKKERVNYNYDVGLEFQYNFLNDKFFRFYFLAGTYYYFDSDENKYTDLIDLQTNNSYNYGIGVGIEYFFKRFVISVDLGYKYYNDNKVFKTEKAGSIIEYPLEENVTKVAGGIGIGFVF